jgi:hypothetical protein
VGSSSYIPILLREQPLFRLDSANIGDGLTMLRGLPDSTGMGGRVRTCGAHLVILQKPPIGVRAKSLPVIWETKPVIRTVHCESIRVPRSEHVHKKPIGLTAEIILAVTKPEDTIVDPTAGAYTTLAAALGCHRHCYSTDLIEWRG